jgi:hypothetical protein
MRQSTRTTTEPGCFLCGLVGDELTDLVVAPVTILAAGGRLDVALCEVCLREARKRAREWERRRAA